MTKFTDLGISKDILKGISELGFVEAMPVQIEVIPVVLESKRDIVALAQTGTGKTAAFGLPIVQQIDISKKYPQALILSPTRELCVQIAKDLMAYSKYVDGLKVLPIYGGANMDAQIRGLKMGTHVIVATPGRILDLIKRKKADISNVETVVLDESDEMLNMGFRDDLNEILESVPNERRTLLFSATMPKEVALIAKKYMSNPEEITIGKKNAGAENVTHSYYLVQARDRYSALKRIADMNPDIYAIVFCRTRMETKEVAEWLIKDGYNADALHGDLSQAQRDHVMARFRSKSLQMLVATDVAARGLDVNDLTHVINYNLPDELEAYTHRSGRTGRAGKDGISIAIIHLREKYRIREIEKKINKTFEKATIPTGKEVCGKQLFHLIDKMENVEVNHDQIDTFLPEIYKKLGGLEKEDLIKRFVSLEFNRFLEYYKNAPDLNVSDERDSGNRERGGRRANNGDFKRLFVNVGKNHGLNPQRLMGLVNEATGERNIEIGRIDVMKSFSFFEIDKQYTDKVLEGLNSAVFEGISVSSEIAKERQAGEGGSDRDSRRSGRGSDRDSRRSSGGGERSKSYGEKRSSDGDRYGRRSSSSRSGGGERSSGSRSGGGEKSSGGPRRSRPRTRK
ncbi:MAG TPA: DEAD/DEAH box helicase [Bacteroidales bacterium]|nr:DEAD/DEAH box helicase [Bacteroidales bacterium]